MISAHEQNASPKLKPWTAFALSFARFGVVLMLLLVPWPGVATAGSIAVSGELNTAAAVLLPSTPRRLRYEPRVQVGEWHPQFVIIDGASGARLHTGFLQLHYLWHIPMSFFVASMAGWPPRRWKAAIPWALGGFAVLQVPAIFGMLWVAIYLQLAFWPAWYRLVIHTAYVILVTPSVECALAGSLWLFTRARVERRLLRDWLG